MKLLLALLSFVALVAAQDQKDMVLGEIIHIKVATIVLENPGLKMQECIDLCDDEFGDPLHEMHTDALCKHACECEILQNCEEHTHLPCPTHMAGMTHHDGVVC